MCGLLSDQAIPHILTAASQMSNMVLIVYLPKVQEQLASLNNCPWCAAKGLTCALRSYRINFHESIILCPSPQCLYPLVSRPLEDVLASLVPPDPQKGVKRKISCGEEEDPVPKRPREEEEDEEEEDTRLHSGDVTHTGKTQSTDTESTDTEVTDKNKHRLLETEVIEGYHKDSDWPVEEETDREVAHGEEATAVSKMAAAVDLLFSPQEAVVSSEEAEGKETALCAPVEAVPSIAAPVPSQTEDGSLVLHTTVSSSDEAASIADNAASTADEAASTLDNAASTADEAASTADEAASTLDNAASTVDEAASIADEAASTADEAASTAADEAASTVEEAASTVEEAASTVEEAASTVEEAASTADEAASTLDNAASTADEAASTAADEAASIADQAASTVDEAISAVVEAASMADEAASMEDEATSTADEATSIAKEAASTIDEAISAVVEAAYTSNKAVSPHAEAVVSSECEEDVLSMGEEVQTEVPLQAMDTPCSMDLRSPGIPNKEEDPASTTITTPAPDREELAETEQKRCTGEDELNALDNGEQASQALQSWLKSGTKRFKVKPVLNQGPVCSNELVPAPSQLFWRNEHKLCWLDTLMVAMVNCRALRERRPKSRPRHATLWELCETYDQACALLRCYQQHYQGDEETPVFAMPLLLKLDTWAEPQFQLVYRWEFLCCHRKSKNSYVKTLSTFTEVVPDWHPLNAVHQARCGTCRKQVTRMMQLESVPPVFALHFEKGLPCTDVSNYSFSFHDNHYSVTMVIQYLLQKHFVTWIRKPDGSWLEFDDLKHPECLTHNKLTIPAHEMHVVFWERENNGRNLLTCSSSDGFAETRSVVRELDRSLEAKDLADEAVSLEAKDLADEAVSLEAKDFLADEAVSLETEDFLADESVSLEAKDFLADESVSLEAKDFLADESVSLEAKDFLADESVSLEAEDILADEPVDPLDRSHDLSLHVPQDDTDIVEALTLSSDEEVAMDTNVAADIGSATLLDAFEGLSHSDIVTLTLVEVKVDPEEKPLDSDGPVPESGPSSSCEVPPSDSSAPDTPPQALETSSESSPEMATSKVRSGIIQPSVMSTPSEVSPVEITTPVSSIPSVKPLGKPFSRKKKGPAPLWVTVDPEENPLDIDDPVPENGLSSSCEVLAHSPAPDTPPHAPETSHESSHEMATSEVHRGIIKPSVVSTPSEVSPLEVTTPVSSIPSVKPLAQRRSRKKKGPAPPLVVRVDPEENQLDIDHPVPDIDHPVPENGHSSSCEVLAHSPAPDTPPQAPETSHESSSEMATSKVRRGKIQPSVVSTPSEVSTVEITTPVSSIASVKPLAQRRSRKKKGPAPPLVVRVDPEENQLDIDGPVPENGLSSSCEVLAHSPAPDTPPRAPATSHESSPEMATSKVCRGIILPSVISTPSEVSPVEITTPVSSIPSVKPLAKPLSRTTAEPAPINIEKSGWTHLLNNHPAISSNSTSAPSTQRKPQLPNQSNAIPLRRPQLLKGVRSLRKEDNEALPAKAAEMYGGFPARGANHPTEPKTATVPHTQSATHKSNRGAAQNGTPKVPLQPRAPFPRNPSINNAAAVSVTRPPPPGVTTELPKISSAKKHGGSHKSKVPPGLDDTAALRYKLLKKLKAKKKRLDELNQRLGFQGDAARGQPPAPKPDSTALDSPYDVSSTTSVYNSPVYDEFFAELLSPTTTASSNLSPDSTGLLLANGQEGGGDTAYAGSPIGGARQENAVTLQLGKPVETPAVDGFMTTTDDNFMDEFISGADMQQQTEMETEELNVLEMFF